MRKKIIALGLTVCMLFSVGLGACKKDSGNISEWSDENISVQKNIKQVDLMPQLPRNYQYMDYLEKAQGIDRLLFEFAKTPEYVPTNHATWTPIGYWVNNIKNKYMDGRGFGLPSYVGHYANGSGSIALASGGQPEGVTVLNALWGASVAGIDKSNQSFTGADGTVYTYDFVDMAKQYYSSEGVFNNRIGGMSGTTFWYEVFPQVQYARLMNMYEKDADERAIILEGAEKWLKVMPKFVDKGNGRFGYTSYSFFEGKPVLGAWVEPVGGALAFLFINAYEMTGDMKYIDAAKECIEYHETDIRNPNYETLQDYIAYSAAYLNFHGFADYNLEKFVNFIFDAEDDNRNTGVVQGEMWGDFDANGLMGYRQNGYSNNSRTAWAFTMNTFLLSTVLGPILNYDTRFADDIGKWYLNVVNSARLFYGETLDSDHKSDPEMDGDIAKYIPYEGTSRYQWYPSGSSTVWDESVSPYAMGDPTIRGWGQTDLGIYGGAGVGFLSVAKETDVEMILQVDISRMNDFKDENAPQQYLYYNPFDESKEVTLDVGDTKVALFDTIRNKVISESVQGKTKITVPAKSSVIVALISPNAVISHTDGWVTVDGVKLSKEHQASVSITSHVLPRRAISGIQTFKMDYNCYEGDIVERMVIKFENHTIYDGKPVNSYDVNINDIPADAWVSTPTVRVTDGRQQITYSGYVPEGAVKVMIYTKNGCYDISTIRIRKG